MYVARKIFIIIVTISVSFILCNNAMEDSILRDNSFNIIPEYDEVYYEYLSYNNGSTQREALCNVLYNLNKEGYTNVNIDYQKDGIDCIIKNPSTDDVWRFYYDNNVSHIIFFNNDYENSFEGQTYITERR